MIDLASLSLISAATALAASIVGPIVTLYIGKAQIRASVLSTNRQKWINEVRDLVASFVSQVAVFAQIRRTVVSDGKLNLAREPAIMDGFERLVFTFTKIRLLFNPHESDHRRLVDVMQQALHDIRTAPMDADMQSIVETANQEIITLSQIVLKREWNRVKRGN